MLRLLLLGGTGRLGSAVRRAAGRHLNVAVRAPGRAELDLEALTIETATAAVDPGLFDVVLNCAAAAHVDRCETEREHAFALNARAPGLIAVACAAANVPFVHISTDYVFGATGEGPFGEDATRSPAQYYGETKAEGERRVLAAGGRRTVARVSWLFGPEARPYERFVLGQVGRGEVRVMADYASRPTWLPGLADWLLGVCGALADGAFAPPFLHPAGGPSATREDWARAVLDVHGYTDTPVVDQGPLPAGLAPRARDTRLCTTKTDAWIDATWAGGFPSPRAAPRILDWRDALRLDRD
jgi:dTDP-4-dehydrorhamnose reductase